MNATTKVALLVHACDRYEFLYKGFDHFFTKHWDFSIPCTYYFATEEKDANIFGFENIKSGKGEWADRLALLLRDKIDADYILYFQEDMWLNKNVNPGFFTRLFQLAIENKWNQVKLHSADVYQTIPTDLFIEGFNVATIDNAASRYLMSHQVTLWNKAFLLEQLHRNEHPWRNERRGTKRLKKLNPVIQHIDYFAENGHPPINSNDNPILRSGYQTISFNGLLHERIVPFIKKLLEGDQADQTYAAELQNHFDHELTHDGKPKPRKEDIFQRLKKWLRELG